MAWYDFLLGRTEKENPAQYVIAREEGLTIDSRENVLNYRNAYETLEIVNRAVNKYKVLHQLKKNYEEQG